MLIYNVTTKVEPSVAEEWVCWMKEIHMPQVLATGCFERCQLLRLLDVDDEHGPTYAAQYYANDMVGYSEYLNQFAPSFRQDVFDRWGDKCIAFRSLMEVVD